MYIQEQEKENRRLAKKKAKDEEITSQARKVMETRKKVHSKYMRLREAKVYYCLGANTIQRLAKEAKATIRIGRCVLIDTEILEKYIDSFRED
ncbi:MAG: hypothetical protein K5894_11715 [Lachnospiraceae bacterium]|nr:hypothetical protein [Lachnospiraceae bacterium]